MNERRKQRYGLRKLSIGAVSCFLGSVVYFGAGMSVQAEEVEPIETSDATEETAADSAIALETDGSVTEIVEEESDDAVVAPSQEVQEETKEEVSETAQATDTSEDDAVLSTNASVNAKMEVVGHTSGADWTYKEAKDVKAVITDMGTTNEHTLQIELAEGMQFMTFVWNDAWGSVPTGVRGTKVAMPDSIKSYLTGNTITVENGRTILSYTISKLTDQFTLSGMVSVKPDDLLWYDGDAILNAVTLKLLDKDKKEINEFTKRYSSVTRNSGNANDGLYLSQWNKDVYNSTAEQQIFSIQLQNRINESPLQRINAKSVTMVLPLTGMPITEVTKFETNFGTYDSSSENWSWDAATKTLTIKDIEWDGRVMHINVYGKALFTGSTEGRTWVASSALASATITMYDGQQLSPRNDYAPGAHFYNNALDSFMVQGLNGGIDLFKTPPGGTSRLGQINNANTPFIFAPSDLKNQTMTWDFDTTKLNAVVVSFPVDKANEIIVTSVTLDNGKTSTVRLIKSKEGARRAGIVTISVDELIANDSTLAGGKYIKSITASIGDFAAGFGVSDIIPIGKASAEVESTVLDGATLVLPYTVTTNGKTNTLNLIYSSGNVSNGFITRADFGKTAVEAGSEQILHVDLNTFGVYGSLMSTELGNLYFVVPQGFSLNPEQIKAYYRPNGSAASQVDVSSDVQYKVTQIVRNGLTYDVYTIWTEGVYQRRHDEKGNEISSPLYYKLPLSISKALKAQTVDWRNHLFVGNGTVENYGSFTTNISTATSGAKTIDIWGLGSTNTTRENGYLGGSVSRLTQIIENEDISVTGYLSQENGSGQVQPYNPVTQTGAVSFKTGTHAIYNVIVSNTITDGSKGNVNAYIPIPRATINGSTITSNNTGGASAMPSQYQYEGYNWPMRLSSAISNTNGSNFAIRYWLGNFTLDANGRPVSNGATIKNANQLTTADLPNVTLVEIIGTNIGEGEWKFALDLMVDITADQAMDTGANETVNAFRPYFYREATGRAGFVNGNYVGAKLQIANVGGMAFYDADADGLYNLVNGDTVLSGVKVELLKGNTVVATTTTNSKGQYEFADLDLGQYKVRITNPDTSVYQFTKNVKDSATTVTVNSDMPAGKSATGTFDIDLTNVLISGANANINAGFLKPIDENGNGEDDRLETKYTIIYMVDGKEYARFEDRLIDTATPTPEVNPDKPDYTFKEWKNFSATVKGNATYECVWAEDKNNDEIDDSTQSKYTVTYKDGANQTVFKDQTYSNILEKLPTPQFEGSTNRPGYIFKGWNKVDGKVDATVTGNKTYTAVWAEDKNHNNIDDATETKYTVTYKDGVNQTVFKDQTTGNLLPGVATPAFTGSTNRPGYIFKGWDKAVAATVSANVTYTATWAEDKNHNNIDDATETKYTVTYTDGVDGEVVFADQVTKDLLVGFATPEFEGSTEREGYVFQGWNTVGGKVDKTVTGNKTYKAIWAEDKNNNKIDDATEDHFTIVYMVDGAEYARFENVLTLTDTPLPATPDKVDYTFKEWTPKWAPKVSQDMVYECVWAEDFNNDEIDDSTQEHFTVTYTDGVDGEEVFKDVVFTDVLVDLPVPSFGANPERKNYIFNGWAPELTDDSTVTADITYVAQWLEDFNNDGIDDATQAHYTVTYSDGAGGEVFADEVYKDVLVDTATPAFMGDVTRKGYLFNGWDKAVAKTVTADVTYTATWLRDENGNGIEDDKEIYTITLDYGYDNKVQTITAKYGDIITIPDPGKRYGYNFVYWQGSVYYPGDLYRVTENHVLSAIWDAKDVEIVIPGNDPIPGKFGEEIEIPSTVPTAPEGYEFAGWQLDDGRIVMPGDKLLIDFESMNFSPIWKKVENKSGATTKAGGVQTSVAGASTWMGAMGLASLGLLKKRKDEE